MQYHQVVLYNTLQILYQAHREVYAATVTVEFESAVYTSSEDAGSVTVCTVIRGESAGEEIKIRFFTEEQTAKGMQKLSYNYFPF